MNKHDPFVRLPHAIIDSPEFVALNPIDVVVLVQLARKFNGHNNGDLAFGVREAARKCHCGQTTACRAFANLQKASLITATYKGHLVPEIGRPDVATRWQLNFLMNAPKRPRLPKPQHTHAHRRTMNGPAA
jgi:hypothetical protein